MSYVKSLEKRLLDAEKVIAFYGKEENYVPIDYKCMHYIPSIGNYEGLSDNGNKARDYSLKYPESLKPDIGDFFEDPNKTTNVNYKNSAVEDVYCGRGSGRQRQPENCDEEERGFWGNPIVEGEKCMMCRNTHLQGKDTLKCYEWYLREKLKNDIMFRKAFFKLKGKRLSCFCKPNPCHTDIMIKYLDTEAGDMFRSNND